jgi:hypothetical protein
MAKAIGAINIAGVNIMPMVLGNINTPIKRQTKRTTTACPKPLKADSPFLSGSQLEERYSHPSANPRMLPIMDRWYSERKGLIRPFGLR